MAVTYRPRKRAVPYKTRLTGRLISEANAFWKKTRLTENEGFGVTRRTPHQFSAVFIGFLELGMYFGTYNPFRPDL